MVVESRTLGRQTKHVHTESWIPERLDGEGWRICGKEAGWNTSCDLRGKGCGMRDMWYPLTSRSTPEVRTAHRHQPQRRHLKSSVSLVKAYWLHNRLNSHVPFLQDADHHRETDLQWAAFGRSQTKRVCTRQRRHHRLAEGTRLQGRAHLDSNCSYFLKLISYWCIVAWQYC